jgi:hypothetical protein
MRTLTDASNSYMLDQQNTVNISKHMQNRIQLDTFVCATVIQFSSIGAMFTDRNTKFFAN